MGDDRPEAGRSKRGMRRGDDGVWFDTRTGVPVGPDDAWWVEGLWARWELPLPPSVRRQISGSDDEDGAGDRVPRLPITPLPSMAVALDRPTKPLLAPVFATGGEPQPQNAGSPWPHPFLCPCSPPAANPSPRTVAHERF